MSKAPAFQHYVKQWLGDDKVMLMDWDARGVHFHLMNIAWQQEPPCSIPADDETIRKWVTGLSDKQWVRIKAQVLPAWELRDGRYYQKGLERAFERQKIYSKNAKSRYDKPNLKAV